MPVKKIAVILSGCGHQDGAEIHEATLTLWAIHKNGAEFQCFAPDIPQHHVLNHLTGEELPESRNVLVESARIARGKIQPLSDFSAAEFDGLVIPGGFGAAKNLSDFAFKGVECSVNGELVSAIKETHAAQKPIGALCIAPVLLAKILGRGRLTIGQDSATAEALTSMGAEHKATRHEEIVIDPDEKLITTPCYMLDARVDQIGAGAEKLIKALLELA